MRLPTVEEAERLEASLIEFFEAAWPEIDPAPFTTNWHLEAIAEHLEAVSRGEIRKLAINLPPRHGKTLLCGVAWNAWTWANRPDPAYPLLGPQAKFMYLSYGDQLSMDTATTTRRLIQSPWYQARWGDRVKLRGDQEAKAKFDTTKGGTRISASFGGSVLGRGGDIRVIDDPHKVTEVESEDVRRRVIQTYDETIRSRVTDPKTTAEVIIMHRLHENDLTGYVLSEDDDWVHLKLPAEYDSTRKCVTVLDWEDPRTEDGELLWPAKWGEIELAPFKRSPYLWSGQYMQSPTPRGGGIIKIYYWQDWPAEIYPPCEYVLASLDTASTEKEENDASALTVWGIFRDSVGNPKAILMYAWEGRLELHDLVFLVGMLCSVEGHAEIDLIRAVALFNKGEIKVEELLRFPVMRLLVEAKHNGHSVAHELIRLFGHAGNFSVELIDTKVWGDKVARLIATEPLFADEMIYAPNRQFAERVINNVAAAPKTTKWDTPDSMTQALLYMRRTGLLLRKEEQARETTEALTHRSREPDLY